MRGVGVSNGRFTFAGRGLIDRRIPAFIPARGGNSPTRFRPVDKARIRSAIQKMFSRVRRQADGTESQSYASDQEAMTSPAADMKTALAAASMRFVLR
jgi:hypothetical protein